MSTPFLDSYRGDRRHSMAFVTPIRDLVPTRDCSLGTGSLFSYKSTGTAGTMPSGHRRGRVPRFCGALFGELSVVEELSQSQGFILGFRCPEGAVCSTAALYWKQIASLRNIIAVEESDAGCICTGSWFSMPFTRAADDPKRGMFHVYVKATMAPDMDTLRNLFSVGDLMRISAAMQRIDLDIDGTTERARPEYSLVAASIGWLTAGEVPRRLSGSARLGIVNTNSMAIDTEFVRWLTHPYAHQPPTFMSMLPRLEHYGRAALAEAEYLRDFVPLRQRSFQNGSLFVFKRLPEQTYGGRHGTRHYLANYTGLIFGRVDGIFTVGDAVYGGTVDVSWSDCGVIDSAMVSMPDCVYVKGDSTNNLARRLAVEKEVMMYVSLARLDREMAETGDTIHSVIFHGRSVYGEVIAFFASQRSVEAVVGVGEIASEDFNLSVESTRTLGSAFVYKTSPRDVRRVVRAFVYGEIVSTEARQVYTTEGSICDDKWVVVNNVACPRDGIIFVDCADVTELKSDALTVGRLVLFDVSLHRYDFYPEDIQKVKNAYYLAAHSAEIVSRQFLQATGWVKPELDTLPALEVISQVEVEMSKMCIDTTGDYSDEPADTPTPPFTSMRHVTGQYGFRPRRRRRDRTLLCCSLSDVLWVETPMMPDRTGMAGLEYIPWLECGRRLGFDIAYDRSSIKLVNNTDPSAPRSITMTVFSVSQDTYRDNVNKVVGELMGSHRAHWLGNVLVVREDTEGEPIHIDVGDVDAAKQCVRTNVQIAVSEPLTPTNVFRNHDPAST
ncbi:hypothetical protein C8R43DRAFT_949316 [Mycena crocata]|nr:hypothetical protein C8R43DRAFT_949316 [Mycena crocata]